MALTKGGFKDLLGKAKVIWEINARPLWTERK